MLILNENMFDGALPATLWSILPNLHFLDVSSNTLTGPLPKLTTLTSTNYSGATFNLSNNLFYGPLYLNNTLLSKFKIIDLSSNYFQGEVQVGGFKFSNSVSLAKNCLQMIPNQRDFWDCRVFYAERNLPFSPGAPEPMQSPLQDSKSRNKNNKRVIFIVAGGPQMWGADIEVESPVPPKDPDFVAGIGELFTHEQVLRLTDNFAEVNLIKHGHSGDLFKGTLEGGVTVVVKKVDWNLCKNEPFMVELGLLSKVTHARLVPLLGHCLENEHEKYIIYKHMPNGDLATSLHKVNCSDDKLKSLDWITRLKIAIGAAEGLSYLHECSPPLVHRDVQARSILLDDKFEVRLGSLSEVTAQGDLHQSVISRIFCKSSSFDQGNSGSSSATCAYDVYCFGKVLLELITGNIGVSKSDDPGTKEWLDQTLSYISIYDKEQVTGIVDPSLIIDDDLLEEVWAMAIVARSCLNPKPSKRPPMRYVLKALENPVKIVREENYSSARLRTTSSRRSWRFAFFGSWRQSSSETATNREGTSGLFLHLHVKDHPMKFSLNHWKYKRWIGKMSIMKMDLISL
ncbi:Serine-threonine/tyrosine-protein kinase, catalytic domain [Sesbania bispinosa]|nr:Serine-threonine/tyrosine-protein kinase, catalytic domain [Sesbania bispinosa]